MRPILPYLELLATQVCNLSCAGCSTYSDLPHRGYTAWSQCEQELAPWLEVIDIEDIGIMGGEPLINPDIKQWLQGIRKLLPTSRIRFPTNGLLLERHMDIVDWLYEDGNAVFKITVHTNDHRVQNAIDLVMSRYRWQPIHEYGIDRLVTDTGLRFHVKQPTEFTQTFRNSYHDMAPYDNDPVKAYALCHQQTCPMLYQGRIYKCSTSALTRTALERHGWPNLEQWKPHLDNQSNGSIGLDSTSLQIQQFVKNFGQPHATCRQCPTAQDSHAIEHLKWVKIR